MSHKPLARETFILRRTAPSIHDPLEEMHVLDDLFPMRGNKPVLFVRSNAGASADDSLDDAAEAEVLIEDSPDKVTWSSVASVTVPAGGRDRVVFTTSAKHVRFRLAGEVPNGAHCELIHYHYDPVRQAEVMST
jgi:hypothetical protein